ncbi:MAG: LapA family protein [Zoogloeaceae bacterium]|jgi:uncharacterized integral membrane protein|nr:LapA family protein [Zoogloeaceae bacterium]
MPLLRILIWAVRLVVVLFVFLLALKNSDPVTLRFFFGMTGQTPLAWLVLLVFTAGVLVGMLVLAGGLFRARRKIRQLTRQNAQDNPPASSAETLPQVES